MDTVPTRTPGVQRNTDIAFTAIQITSKTDAVVKWLTVSLATHIVQLHHSHSRYEHMINDDDDDEFPVKLLVFDIVVFLPE